MKKLFIKIYTIFASVFLPFLVFAQTSSSNSVCGPIKYTKSLQWYLCELYKILGQYIIPLLMLAATGFFMWNIFQYIRFADSEQKRTEYRKTMVWGVVALFVMVSIWGIIAILGGIAGVNTSIIPQITY